jgi:hypothetical protein
MQMWSGTVRKWLEIAGMAVDRTLRSVVATNRDGKRAVIVATSLAMVLQRRTASSILRYGEEVRLLLLRQGSEHGGQGDGHRLEGWSRSLPGCYITEPPKAAMWVRRGGILNDIKGKRFLRDESVSFPKESK